jgi:hypothetical protein
MGTDTLGRLARIFVRRGALRRFDRLTRDAAELPVSVEWDRRVHERRTSGTSPVPVDHRERDRRREPAFTWKSADFVVAPPKDDA